MKHPTDKQTIGAVLAGTSPHRALELKNVINDYKNGLMTRAFISMFVCWGFIALLCGILWLVGWLGWETAPDFSDPTPLIVFGMLPLFVFLGVSMVWDGFIFALRKIIEDGVKNGSE